MNPAIALVIYVFIGLFTFAWIVETVNIQNEAYAKGGGQYTGEHDRDGAAVMGGMFWPLYWSGKAAISIVHWTNTKCAP